MGTKQETPDWASSWLWPDHAIDKRESRNLRETHNKLVNSHADLLETLQMAQVACENACIKLDEAFVWSEGGWSQHEGHGKRIFLLDKISTAIAKAEGTAPIGVCRICHQPSDVDGSLCTTCRQAGKAL
jgi:hypothetical protein